MRRLATALGMVAAITGIAFADELKWFGYQSEEGASLIYGIPESDYAPLSFHCERGSGEVSFTFAFAPIMAKDGVQVVVTLETGDISVPIATTGTYLVEIDQFLLEGKTALDYRLTDLLMSDGTLSVFVEDGSEEYPLDGAREAARSLLELCKA